MKRATVSVLLVILLSSMLAACDGMGTPEQTPVALTPALCVTATPTVDSGASSVREIATPAGRATPPGGPEATQSTLSPSELATREAQLEQQNRPVELPSSVPLGATSLPVCPTLAPTR